MIPFIALIYDRVFKEAFILSFSGIVGKGKVKTSGIPIVFNCKLLLTLFVGNNYLMHYNKPIK